MIIFYLNKQSLFKPGEGRFYWFFFMRKETRKEIFNKSRIFKMNNKLLSLFKGIKDILDNNGQECKSFHIKNIQPSFKSLNYDDKYDVISIRNK